MALPVGLGVEVSLFLMLLLMFALVYAFRTVFVTLIRHTIGLIPGVGGFIADRAEGVLNAALTPILNWLKAHIALMIRWLQATKNALLDLPHEIVLLGNTLHDALAYLKQHTIVAAIHIVTDPLAKRLRAAETAVADIGKDVAAIPERIRNGIDKLRRDLSDELEHDFTVGIDRLRHDIFDRAIPAVEGEIAAVGKAARAGVIGAEQEIADIAGYVGDLARRLDIPVAAIEAIIAAVGVTAAIEALEQVVTCRGKLAKMCTSDPDVWAGFIEGLLLLAFWPGLEELVEDAATILDDVVEPLAEFIVSGG